MERKEQLPAVMQKILDNVMPLLAVLMPLFFLPMSLDFFTSSKKILLAVMASIVLLIWAGDLIRRKKVELIGSSAAASMFILALLIGISSFLRGVTLSKFVVSEAGTLIYLILLFLIISSLIKKNRLDFQLINFFSIAMAFVSAWYVAQFLGLMKLTGIEWLSNTVFNPVGGPVGLVSLTIPLIAANAFLMVSHKSSRTSLTLSTSFLMSVGTFLALYSLYSSQDLLLPLLAGWSIAIGAMQDPLSAVIGTGPGSFAQVYTQLKPIFMNTTPAWNMIFPSSSNTYLHILTTFGFGGLGLYLYSFGSVLISAFRVGKKRSFIMTYAIFLATLLLVQFFLPPNIVAWTASFLVLTTLVIALNDYHSALTTKYSIESIGPLQKVENTISQVVRSAEENFNNKVEKIDLLYYFMGLVAVVAIGFNTYYLARNFLAERDFYLSVLAAGRGEGTEAYNKQNSAISWSPLMAEYRIAYSQTNIALANSIAQKENLSEEDRNNISALVSQALREAQAAVQLEPASSTAWQNMANIYRQLIGVMEGADQATLQAYQQAISLNPNNPQLRLELGGVFYSAQNYQEAINLFTQAIQLKNDWANAYYNLAIAYRDAGQNTLALQAMRIVGQLIDPTGADYQQVQDEIESLSKLAEEEQKNAQNQSGGESQTLPVTEEEGADQKLTSPESEPAPIQAENINIPAEEVAP